MRNHNAVMMSVVGVIDLVKEAELNYTPHHESSHSHQDDSVVNPGYTPQQLSQAEREIETSNARIQTAYNYIHNALGQFQSHKR